MHQIGLDVNQTPDICCYRVGSKRMWRIRFLHISGYAMIFLQKLTPWETEILHGQMSAYWKVACGVLTPMVCCHVWGVVTCGLVSHMGCYHMWSVVISGCQCRTMRTEIVKTLEAVVMWFLRQVLRIPWMEKKRNDGVLRDDVKWWLINFTSKRQVKYTEIYGACNQTDKVE